LSIKITKGTTPTSLKKQFKEQGINFVKAESYSDEGFFKPQKFAYIDEETHDLLNRSKLEKHDVIVSIAGVLGRVAMINSDILPANTNQAVGIVRLKQNQVSPYYIKYFLSSEYMNKLINIISGQAAQPNINLAQLGSFKVPLPKKETIRLFHEIVVLIHQSQILLSKQNQLLKEARDILLPRLMTGMIDVDQIKLENL
jgi:type I restriction enzyme, S subunit